ncbi:predicted protein [Enterococcus faecium 1,231,501]|nr:predicted protein [Enterococcus faecium 1,231,501]
MLSYFCFLKKTCDIFSASFFQRKVYLVIIRLSKKIQYIISYIRFFGDKKQKRKDVLFASKTFAIDYVVETFGYIRSIIGILTATIVVGKATYFIK